MSLKKFSLAALVAIAAVPAMADDQTIDISSGSGSFISTSPLLSGGDDKITFANLAAGVYSFVVTLSAQNIAGLGASIVGGTTTLFNAGPASFASITGTASGPIELTITGTPAKNSLYSGEITVAQVPEPATYGLLLAGLGAVAFVARRRNRA